MIIIWYQSHPVRMTRPIGAPRAPRTPGASAGAMASPREPSSSSQPENMVSGPRTRRMTRSLAAAAKNASSASPGPATPRVGQDTPSTASTTQVGGKSRLVLVPTTNAVAKERLERELALLKSAVSALSARIEAASSDDTCSAPAPTAADEPPKPRHHVYNVSSLLIEVLADALAP